MKYYHVGGPSSKESYKTRVSKEAILKLKIQFNMDLSLTLSLIQTLLCY